MFSSLKLLGFLSKERIGFLGWEVELSNNFKVHLYHAPPDFYGHSECLATLILVFKSKTKMRAKPNKGLQMFLDLIRNF